MSTPLQLEVTFMTEKWTLFNYLKEPKHTHKKGG